MAKYVVKKYFFSGKYFFLFAKKAKIFFLYFFLNSKNEENALKHALQMLIQGLNMPMKGSLTHF